MTTLPTAVYTANRGYAWSRIPDGIGQRVLDEFLETAMSTVPEFTSSGHVSYGVVSNGSVAAFFAIREIAGWDSVGRAAQYAAFAFAKCDACASIDAAKLFSHPFFREPKHMPDDSIAYSGDPSVEPPLASIGRLLCHNRLEDLETAAIGATLCVYGAKSPRWLFRVDGEAATVETAPWRTGGTK